MHQLEHYRRGAMRTKMNTLMNRIDKYDMSSSQFDNYIHRSLSVILNNFDLNHHIHITETSLDFKELFTHWKRNGIDAPADSYFIQAANSWYTETGIQSGYFIENCLSALMQNKIVYALLDFHNYTPNRPNLITAEFLYECHATSLIMYLDSSHTIQMYHFNPHGQAGAYVNNYQFCTSLRRRVGFPLPTGVDRFVLTHLSESMNRYRLKHHPFLPMIQYSISKQHNYLGPNLQAGDNTGICYVFQALFFCELIEWFDTKKEIIVHESKPYLQLKKQILEPTKTLIRHRQIFEIIMRSIVSLCPALQNHVNMICEGGGRVNDAEVTMSEMRCYCALESMIEEKGNIFIKGLLGALIPFLTQKGIRERAVTTISV